MCLDRLLVEVTQHYAERGFDDHALSFLRWTIISNTRSDHFEIHTALNHFGPYPVCKLLDYFGQCKHTPSDDELQSAKAIFAFSFGYQLADLKDPSPKNRLPGQNNYQLAEIAVKLKKRFCHPIYAQFEIARAIPDFLEDRNNFRTSEEDMSTRDAILQFVAKCGVDGGCKKVIVVAHRHHMERCIIILRDTFGIDGLPSPIAYAKYDPFECQPRAMSPSECIVNDFISMVSMRQHA